MWRLNTRAPERLATSEPVPGMSSEGPMSGSSRVTNRLPMRRIGDVDIVRTQMQRVARLRDLLEARRSGGDQVDEVRMCFQILSVESARSATLGALLDDPGRVRDVPRERIPVLLLQLAALETALASRLEELTTRPDPPAVEPKDRLLTPEEAAALLGVTPMSLRRNWRRYRFARKLSRKTLRFSEAGLRRWIAAKRPS